MSVKEVLRMGNPTLRIPAKEFSKDEILSSATENLLQDMYDTMKFQGGIGIAAPQIGISKSVTLIHIEDTQNRYEAESSPLLKIFNPKIIIQNSELQGFWEGCLSVPGLRGFVERPKKIQINYLNEKAQEQTITAEGFLATVFQHEIDHLYGKLYIDRVTDRTKITFNEEFTQFWDASHSRR